MAHARAATPDDVDPESASDEVAAGDDSAVSGSDDLVDALSDDLADDPRTADDVGAAVSAPAVCPLDALPACPSVVQPATPIAPNVSPAAHSDAASARMKVLPTMPPV